MTDQAVAQPAGPLPPGSTHFVVGPPGSGKSSLIRSALEALGGGVVILAPGQDEVDSYRPLFDRAQWATITKEGIKIPHPTPEKPYLFGAFDDEFLPSLSGAERGKAHGLANAVRFVRGLSIITQQWLAEGKGLPWPIMGTDTFTAMGTMASSAMLDRMGVDTPPKAKGEGGAEFYIGYRQLMEEATRVHRAVRGYGVHWIATGHITEKETTTEVTRGEEAGTNDAPQKKQLVPLFTGAFRDTVNATFNLVWYSGIRNGKYVLRWKGDSKRPAKSRVGVVLADKDGKAITVPNDWKTMYDAYMNAKHVVVK